MSGPPQHRHQIEFTNDIAEFFDDYSRDAEIVPLSLHGQTTIWRPLTYRGTDYGQWTDIWRLGLPTLAMGGVVYAGNILHFERVLSQGGAGWLLSYEVTVVAHGSVEHLGWRQASTANGEMNTTSGPGGREYGWYL